MIQIEIEDNKVRYHGKELTGDYPVYDARFIGELLLVLYRPESHRGGQFQNLVAFDAEGRQVWKAELPTTSSMDAYYQLVSESPIVVDSYCFYRCTIDAKSGRIVKKEFFK